MFGGLGRSRFIDMLSAIGFDIMLNITRFLRYPGSKRRMLTFLMQFLPDGRKVRGRYIEPFVGSGSVFFSISPGNAILADINPDLIDLLKGIQLDPGGFGKLIVGTEIQKKIIQRQEEIDKVHCRIELLAFCS